MERIELTTEEQEAVVPSMARLQAIRSQYDIVTQSITPFLVMLAKNNQVSLEEYDIATDGTALVKREVK